MTKVRSRNDMSVIGTRTLRDRYKNVRLHTEVIWIREIDERIRLGYG